SLGGTLGSPSGEVSADLRADAAAALLAGLWPIRLGPVPPGPASLELVARVTDRRARVDRLRATIGLRSVDARRRAARPSEPFASADGLGAVVELAGSLPLQLGGGRLAAADGELSGTIDAELVVPDV